MCKKLMAVVVVMLVLTMSLSVPLAYADGYGKKGGHCKKGVSGKLFYKAHKMCANQVELGLSDDQFQAIKTIKINAKKDKIRRKADIELVDIDIQTAMWEDPIDVDAINALIDKKYELKKEKTKSMVKAYANLQKVLTDEQKETLKSLRK